MAGIGELTVAQMFYIFFIAATLAYKIGSMIAASTRGDYQSKTQEPRRGQLVNTCDNRIPLPLIYGRTRVGINRVYAGLSGDDNKYLHIIGNICEGPILGFVQRDGVDQLFLGDKLWNEYGGLVYYELFTGTPDQEACATLHAAIPEWNEPKRYTAYIYVRLEYDQDTFSGIPDITLEIDGLIVYVPSTETQGFSRNSAPVARDFLTRSSKRGGMGYGTNRILAESVEDSEAYCEDKGWTCDLCLRDEATAIDLFQHILTTFRGVLIYSDSIFKLRYRDLDYETSVMDLTEDDIVEQGQSTLRIIQPNIFDTPNAVRCRYPNIDKKYIEDDFVFSDPVAIAADGDYRERQIDMLGMTSQANVMKMANYFLERARVNKEASLIMGSRGMALEPNDPITLTHSRPGWDQKLFRVNSATVSYEGGVALKLEKEDPNFYNDTYDLTERSWHDTTLPDPSDFTLASVINVSHSEELYNYRGRSFTRWKIDFDRPAAADFPWWDYADIYLKIGSGDWKFMTKSGGNYQVDPVEEGVTYYCRIVSVSIWGTKQAFDDGYTVSKTIEGNGAAPSNVTGFEVTASGNVVVFTANEVTDADVIGYEIRMGVSWAAGSFIGFNLSPKFRATYVTPGEQTFWIAAKNNAGLYSVTPASDTATVPYPSNYDYKTEWEWDYSTGTHSNTEKVTHDADDHLKCSHGSSVLTGTWQSPTYDFGEVKRIKIYGDFVSHFHEGSKSWAGIFPTTWEAKAGLTWDYVLNTGYGGSLTAVLHYGESAWNENTINSFEAVAPEIDCRYIRVDITLTDPESDANMYNAPLNMTALTYT